MHTIRLYWDKCCNFGNLTKKDMEKLPAKFILSIVLLMAQILFSQASGAEKRLKKFTTTEDHYSVALTYDDQGRLVSAFTSGLDSEWDNNDNFTLSLDWSRIADGIVTTTSDSRSGYMDDGDLSLRLNATGLLTEVIGAADSSWDGTWSYMLDQNGYCTSIFSQEEGLYDNYTWVDGDFTSAQDHEVVFFYSGKSFSDPVESRSSVVSAFFNSYSGGLSAPGTAVLSGMIKGSRHLVDYIIDEGDMEYFVYEFDSDGYPVRVEQRLGHSGELYAEFTFEWENADSGLDTPCVDATEAPCYISIDGMVHSHPVRGINLRRNSDGTISKILFR